MDIGEVAERSGMRVSTLRYYEEMRLIRSSGRRGLRRQFETDVLERLALISLGQSAGFTLGEIARVLTPPGRPAIDRKSLATKADELDRSITRLTAMRDGLRHAAVCPAPSHLECPTFRRLLASAIDPARVSPAGSARRRRPAASRGYKSSS